MHRRHPGIPDGEGPCAAYRRRGPAGVRGVAGTIPPTHRRFPAAGGRGGGRRIPPAG